MTNIQTSNTPSRIRDARNELKLSQERFAERLGTSRRRVIAWESESAKGNTPSSFYLRRIAEVTGKSIEYFLDGGAPDDSEDRLSQIRRIRAELILAGRDDLADDLRFLAGSLA